MFSLFRSSAIGIVVKAQGDFTHYSPARSADVLRYTRRGVRQIYGLAQKLLKITASSRTIKNSKKKCFVRWFKFSELIKRPQKEKLQELMEKVKNKITSPFLHEYEQAVNILLHIKHSSTIQNK